MRTFEQSFAPHTDSVMGRAGPSEVLRPLRMAGAAFAMLLVASCGSKTSATPNGSSAGAAGSAGASANGTCAAGDTRACVGPGACSGGQACSASGQWSACDCGSSSSGGQSGASGSSEVGTGGSAGAASGGSAGAPEAGGSGGEAGVSGLNPGDDACPSGTLTADCSGQCAVKTAVCDAVCPTTVTITSVSAGMAMARTPSHPGANCQCDVEGEPSTAYDLTVILEPALSAHWHVSVPAPWNVMNLNVPLFCAFPGTAACATFAGFGSPSLGTPDRQLVTVWTADPNAPAVDVIAEPGDCP
jgi:hypothetical protein